MDRVTKASGNPVTTQQTIGQFIMRNADGRLEIKGIITSLHEDHASFAMVEVFPGGISSPPPISLQGGGLSLQGGGFPSIPSISPQGRRKRSEQGKYGRGNVIIWGEYFTLHKGPFIKDVHTEGGGG